MEMSSPYPINSQLDPSVPENMKNYDYTSPLSASGSNFPCKGYAHQTPFTSKATYQAGGNYEMTIAGSATHDGGSCQLSLSYDSGATFKVIKSMIGGCPITTSYNFTIPEFAPSGQVLFAWSWFNVVGNREMYMNCAQVTIQGSTPGRHRRSQYKRQQTMDSLPNIFVANVNQPTQCATIEGQDVQFPNPGSDVIHGTDSITPQPGSGFTCQNPGPEDIAGASQGSGSSTTSMQSSNPSSTITSTSATASTATSSFAMCSSPSTATPLSGNPTTTAPTTPLTTTTATPITTATPAPPTNTVTPTSSASSSPSSSTLPSGPCTAGTFACNSPTSFSACVGTGYVYMGSVASGMMCQDGQIVRQNDGSCTPDGALSCGPNGDTFFLCDHGGLVNMGPVAPGTRCVDGEIVSAQS